MTIRMTAVGYLAMDRLKPMVKMHLDQSKRYITTRHSNRSRQKAVNTSRQSSESGNPRSPNGENTWDIPVFGKVPGPDVFKLTVVTSASLGLGMMTALTDRQKQISESESKRSKQCNDNLAELLGFWEEIADSRNAVLHRHDDVPNAVFPFLHTWIVTNGQSRHGGAKATNKSTAANIKPAPKNFLKVIRFFMQWEYYDNNKTIDSADLKQQLGSEFDTFRDILAEIRDEEATSWHETDSNNLNKVVDFLNDISKMET